MIRINARELYDFLNSRNINYLYHANTVTTTCTFINEGGLVSRGYVEANGLNQTPQDSDAYDKTMGVWQDVFLDIFDLHGYFPRNNVYGPVCFKIKKEILLDQSISGVCITKNNPQYWLENNEMRNYYSNLNEYVQEYNQNVLDRTIQKKMIILKGNDVKVDFATYLEEIILDNPGRCINNVDIGKYAYDKIEKALEERGFNGEILKTRVCSNCFCKQNYMKMDQNKLERLFA